MKNAAKELKYSHKYKKIRLFDVKMVTSAEPLSDLEAIALPWSLPSNGYYVNIMYSTTFLIINILICYALL